jgi:rubredoxin
VAVESCREAPEGPPATLGSVVAARTRLIVWCKDCRHQVEPDTAEQARRYSAATPVPDYARRLVCSQCGSHNTDFVLTGAQK